MVKLKDVTFVTFRNVSMNMCVEESEGRKEDSLF